MLARLFLGGIVTEGRPRIGWPASALLAGLAVVVVWTAFERSRQQGAERAAFPQTEARVVVPEVAEPVTLLRDAAGVPHVLARSENDAWLGLGYAHAQDRLAQMQWLVRLARGETAEIVGPEGVAADRLARTLGLGRVADAEAEALDEATRARLEAYAAGVNARIGRLEAGVVRAPLAAEALDLPLRHWRPADSLAVLKLHAWALSGTVETSLVLHDLLGALGGVDARPFFPGALDVPPVLDEPPRTAARAPGPGFVDPLRRALGLAGASAGSSAWVVSGAHTESRRPLLAADIHAEPTVPALVHVAHVQGGGLDVAGAMLPGLPIVWSGRNAALAWGATHARAALSDLYTERIDASGENFHDGSGWKALDIRDESIAVRGAEPVVHRVRATRHGPLLDLPGHDPLALAWVGLHGRGGETLAALQAAARAGDADGFRASLAGVSEPSLAVAYVDAKGKGGVQVAGWIPRRSVPSSLVPVPGRARWFDWDDRIPYRALPSRSLSKARGFVVAADNAQPALGSVQAEWLWRSGLRAGRIEQGLRQALNRQRLRFEDAEALQADVTVPRGRALVVVALDLLGDHPAGREAEEVTQLLRAWDGRAEPDSAGAAAYHAFVFALVRRVFAERMGEELFARWLALPQADPVGVLRDVLARTARGKRDVWSRPAAVEAAVAAALRDTWYELSERLGPSRRRWVWGRLLWLRFRPLPPVPDAPGLAVADVGGSGDSIGVAEFAPDAPYRVRLASVYRMVAEPGPGRPMHFQLAPGLSEHPGHGRRTGGLGAWRAGSGTPLVLQRDHSVGREEPRVVLEPAK